MSYKVKTVKKRLNMQSELKSYQAGYEGKLELLFFIILNIKYYEQNSLQKPFKFL